jgi:dynein heavy chain, axonemal
MPIVSCCSDKRQSTRWIDLVTFAQNETYRMLRDLLELQPKTASAGENRDAEIEKLANDVLSNVPHPIPLANVLEKYPVMYEQVTV